MSKAAIARTDYPRQNSVETTFDDFVISVVDPKFISAKSRLYWNRLHPVEKDVQTEFERQCRWRSGLEVTSIETTSGDLDALDIPLNGSEKLKFLAGAPIWHRQGFFTNNRVGEAQTSYFNQGLNSWLAVLTALFRASLIQAFRNDNGRYLPARRGERVNIAEEVRAVLAHAIGYDPQVEGNDAGRIVNARLREANGTVLEFETLARFTMGSAEERARRAINQADRTAYADMMATLALEARQFEALRGAPLDPFALAAWHVHILTVVRLAASAAMALDKNRSLAMAELRDLMPVYERLRRRPNPDAAMLTEEAALRARIEACCQEFNDQRATILPSCNPQDPFALIRVFDHLNIVILAFYTGIDIRDFDSGIATACEQAMAALIESAIWAGRLQRERVARMTPTVALAILSIVTEEAWDGDSDQSLRRCRDLVFSCLTENSWPVLIATAQEVHNTGETKTILFHLAIHGEQLGECDLNGRDREAALPSRSVLANIPRVQSAQEEYFVSDRQTGTMMMIERPVYVTGYRTALPPLYSEEWQNRWGPAGRHLREGVAPA